MCRLKGRRKKGPLASLSGPTSEWGHCVSFSVCQASLGFCLPLKFFVFLSLYLLGFLQLEESVPVSPCHLLQDHLPR